jgi:hypothetical protein
VKRSRQKYLSFSTFSRSGCADDITEVREYFNTVGFERWNKVIKASRLFLFHKLAYMPPTTTTTTTPCRL